MSLIDELRPGDQVHFYMAEEELGYEPAIAIVAKVDRANSEDNARPRLHLSVLHPGLARWSPRCSVPMVDPDPDVPKAGRWELIT